MTEPLQDADLEEYDEVANRMDDEGWTHAGAIVRELLAEIRRLKIVEATLAEAVAQALVDQAQELDMGY